MKKKTTLFFILLCNFMLFAQNTKTYIVYAPSLNIRSGPGTEYDVKTTLKKFDEVNLIGKISDSWWFVDFNGTRGYASSQYLKAPNDIDKSTNKDPYKDWEKKDYESGATPDCENLTPEFDYDIDNYLKISVGSNTDVVVKLMKISSYGDRCIRMAYIRSNETFYIKNVPEGKYYLKIAYGKDWRQNIIGSQCVGKFIKNAKYEKGDEILDFNIQKTYKGKSIPYFELSLDIIMTKYPDNTYNSDNITESEFNK